MPRLYLVRHGRAAASYGEHADPGLDELGHRQAAATALRIATHGPMAVLSSPLARAVETAAPLLARWPQVLLRIEPRVAEIPSPTELQGQPLAARGPWLGRVMAGCWRDQEAALRAWAADVVVCLLASPADAVIFSHFVAINVAAAAAEGSDRVIVFRPDNASVTILDSDGRALRLIERGAEAQTLVN